MATRRGSKAYATRSPPPPSRAVSRASAAWAVRRFGRPARAGMPLPQLAQQLGHATIAMTMRCARFHADYADVGRYFDRVAQALGRQSAPARVRSRVQSTGAGDAGGTGRPATRGGTTDWKTGPAGIARGGPSGARAGASSRPGMQRAATTSVAAQAGPAGIEPARSEEHTSE